MAAPANGWTVVVWWIVGLSGAGVLTALGQPGLAAVVVGALAGATVPRPREGGYGP